MAEQQYKGIDYGRGLANVDKATGIRFGVIPCGTVTWWNDHAEGNYGEARCPECEGEVLSSDDEKVPEGAEGPEHGCFDYYCAECEKPLSSEDCYPEDALSYDVDEGEDNLQASCGDGGIDIFVMGSPYFTRAAYCSPCAPGACYLMSPCEDGERAYCFGHDWFEDGKAPYPVYSVATGELVPPKDEPS
jgi:hypothetical protein